MTILSNFKKNAQQLIPEQKEFLILAIQRISNEQKRIQENKETLQNLGKEIPKNFGSAALKEPMEDFAVICYLLFDSPKKEMYSSKWNGGLASAEDMLSQRLGEAKSISRSRNCDLFAAVGYFLYQNCCGLTEISKNRTDEIMSPAIGKKYMDIITAYAGLSRKGQEKFIQDIQESTTEKVCSHAPKSHKVSREKTR